jgi:peptidoglycan/LPS O-acetylase OafA/YrhL
MTQSSTPHKKLNLLQVYRGIAAVLVVMIHLTKMSAERLNQVIFFNLFLVGWSGVDYFFVLSGFIMVYVHRSAIGKKDQLKSFLVKRAVRIYPIYWIITLTVWCLFLVIPGFANNEDLSLGNVIASLLLIPQKDQPILEVGWTLIYEINFYLLFSIAIWLKPKHSVPLLSAWLLVTILHYRKIVKFPQDFFWLETVFGDMNLELVLGCLAAYIVIKYNNNIGKYRWILFGIANLGYVIMLGMFAAWGKIGFGRIPTFGVLAALLIIAAASIDLKDSPKIPYLLMFLGEASYSIFLTHVPVISAITKILQKANLGKYFDGFFAPALVAVFAVVFGCIFYSLIEKPLTVFLRQNIVEKMFPPKAEGRI